MKQLEQSLTFMTSLTFITIQQITLMKARSVVQKEEFEILITNKSGIDIYKRKLIK